MIQSSYTYGTKYDVSGIEGLYKLETLCPEIRDSAICIMEFKDYMLGNLEMQEQDYLKLQGQDYYKHQAQSYSIQPDVQDIINSMPAIEMKVVRAREVESYVRLSFEDLLRTRRNGAEPNVEQPLMAMACYLRQIHSDRYGFENVSQNLHKLRIAAVNANNSGKTDAEIFMSIYERYEAKFPGFRTAGAVPFASRNPPLAVDAIRNQFQYELVSTFGSPRMAMAAQREALFGNKSDSEIRAAIAASYPPAGEITLREFHYMVEEMRQVGVSEGLEYLVMGSILVREKMLDQPADIRWLSDNFNHLYNDRFHGGAMYPYIRNAGRALKEIFGVNINSQGNTTATNHNPVDFASLIEQLSGQIRNWTILDIERWIEELRRS